MKVALWSHTSSCSLASGGIGVSQNVFQLKMPLVCMQLCVVHVS